MESAKAVPSRKPSMRRAACDRCRAQKLRCVRISENGGKCKRCQSTGTECNYGVPKPSGRPSISQPPRELHLPGQTPETGEVRIGRLYRPDSQFDGCTGRRSNRDNEQLPAPDALDRTAIGTRRVQPTQNEPNDAKRGTDVLQWPVLWPQNLSVSMSPTSVPVTPQLRIPGLSGNDLILPSLAQSQDPMVLNWENGSPIPPVSSSGQSSSELELPTWEPLDEVCWFLDAPEAPSHPTHFQHPATPAVSTETRSANAFREFNARECDDALQISQAGSVEHPQPRAEDPSTSRHDWVQQLSELNMRVHQFLARTAPLEQEVSRTDRAIEFPTEFAGRVIELSSAFVRLLEGMNDVFGELPSVKHRSSQLSHGSSESGDKDYDEEENGFGEICSQFEPDSCNARQDCTPQQSSLLALSDMSTVLQLLAIYLSLQKIHYLLYTAAYYNIADPHNKESVSIKNTSKERRQTYRSVGCQVPVFTGLHLGGVSLEQFTTFQVKLVIQIASHLLGEAEHLLGLPDGCRISGVGNDQGKGILGVSASPQLLRMVIRDMRSSLGECSPIQSTKERLSQLRKSFRGSVSI